MQTQERQKKSNLQIPYGVSDFKTVRNEHLYYIDKSAYIRTLEQAGRFLFFVRPRRFGKSLFINMLRAYYDVAEKENFAELFGDLDIGKCPTENANRYQVMSLDFSKVNICEGGTLQDRFANYMGICMEAFLHRYRREYGDDFKNRYSVASSRGLLTAITACAAEKGYRLYLFIDEYDNFTNSMLQAEGCTDYRSITHGQGFYREWFKGFKGSFDRIFMTGVSPVTMDDLTSGFNIASNVSQDADLNSMLGFSEEECLRLYTDFKGVGKYTHGEPAEWVAAIKPWYDGYCFAEEKRGSESVFNSDMVLYFLNSLVKTGNAPKDWIDVNIATDYAKLKVIADIQNQIDPSTAEDSLPVTEEVAANGEISFQLKASFPADAIPQPENFKSLFYYYGILSMKERRKGTDWFRVPNICVRRQVFDFIRTHLSRTRKPNWSEWSALASAFAYDGEWRPFLERLARDFAETNPVRGGIQGEHRIQGYMQAEFGHLDYYLMEPELELSRGFCDFCLFPERYRFGDVKHSYLIELKYSAKDAPDAELEAKRQDALRQLAAYRADRSVPALARGTTLHQVVFQFRGTELLLIEHVAEEQIA